MQTDGVARWHKSISRQLECKINYCCWMKDKTSRNPKNFLCSRKALDVNRRQRMKVKWRTGAKRFWQRPVSCFDLRSVSNKQVSPFVRLRMLCRLLSEIICFRVNYLNCLFSAAFSVHFRTHLCFVYRPARQKIAFRESVRVAIPPVNKFVSFKSEKVNIVIDIVLHVV